jgi:purine-nucleoside phosphorylase
LFFRACGFICSSKAIFVAKFEYPMENTLNNAICFLKDKGFNCPEIGIILGTGLGKLVNLVQNCLEVSYHDIPGFPVSTVESHAGKLIYGELEGKKVVVMQGRFHYYEGYSMQQITFPIRVMKMLGINTLFVSNAAGAVNLSFKKGSLMVIRDHINLLSGNPLIGKNNSEFGPRFPDMSKPYCPQLIAKMKACGEKQGISLNEGMYAAMQGPMLETAAEYRMLGILGADAVGMSTVPEVIVASHMGMKVAAVSVLTDECDPDNLKPVELSEIIAVAEEAEKDLVRLFCDLIALV